MEDGLNFRIWKTTSIGHEMEDNLNFSGNGRRPQFFRKWKTTSFFQEMEDDLNQDMEEDLNYQDMEENLNF